MFSRVIHIIPRWHREWRDSPCARAAQVLVARADLHAAEANAAIVADALEALRARAEGAEWRRVSPPCRGPTPESKIHTNMLPDSTGASSIDFVHHTSEN